MKAEIINIGDEILIGQIINTNAVWLAQELNSIGIAVGSMITVGDEKNEIIYSIDKALKRHDILIITGGLGPTKDDLTKDILTEYFQTQLIFNQDVFDLLTAFFEKRGRQLNDANKTQCYVPESCEVLMNYWGTAPGMLFKKDNKILVSLPGVPYEMKELMKKYILPFLQKKFSLPPVIHRSFLTEGIPESELMNIIGEWESQLPTAVKLAYLPSNGQVTLRLSVIDNTDGKGNELIAIESEKLENIIGNEIIGYDDETIESAIQKLFIEQHLTLSTAESCTGGYIAHKITSVPRSSQYYMGSVVAYDNRIKQEVLGISDEILNLHGAVSKETVTAMAENIRIQFKTDYSIAVSGIAGPGGGTPDKPIGTVWVAWAGPNGVLTKKYRWGNDRNINIHRTYQASLNTLRKIVKGIPVPNNFWEDSK